MDAPRVVRSVVLDATALTEASRDGTQLRIQVHRMARRGAELHAAASTLTEVLRGHPRDVRIHRLLGALTVRVVDVQLGKAAGERIGRRALRGNVTLNALVAELASTLPRPVVVLTTDVTDLTALVDDDVMVLDIGG